MKHIHTQHILFAATATFIAFSSNAQPTVAAKPAAAPAAAVPAQKLVLSQSSLGFVSRQMGVPVQGKFTRFDVQSNFDPKKSETSKVSFSIDLTSADLGNTETEVELKKPGWFDSAKRPQANFVSSAIKSLGAGKFELEGQLSIKAATQRVVVPLTLTQSGDTTLATGAFQIKRLDFKIGDGDWNDVSIVANEVQVNFKLALTGVAKL
jgi:polyisoprenoid-binding protein YceI